MSELARWQSYKIVKAGKIIAINKAAHWADLVVESANGEPVKMAAPEGLFSRGEPSSGDYLVIYDDGYTSWSPAKAFEEGYLRLSSE